MVNDYDVSAVSTDDSKALVTGLFVLGKQVPSCSQTNTYYFMKPQTHTNTCSINQKSFRLSFLSLVWGIVYDFYEQDTSNPHLLVGLIGSPTLCELTLLHQLIGMLLII